ncbi:hypothetical protein [Sphingobacterium paludis]|uniref:Uncharacterized protein n=1 Tax=Sphingobacterium paludis TaxID=1476465 RepID=A0A4V3E206_9SPHI|nr:hypothetical protein [Sphingobacterium paludis]TDS14758.1 hypothetical protein B0I21_103257 [Sphingobacterium paludis]
MNRKQLEQAIRLISMYDASSVDIGTINETFGLALTESSTREEALTAFIEAKGIELEEQSKWIRTAVELPPPNTLVWAKRSYRGNQTIYFAKRNSQELSTDPDASRNCHWKGIPYDRLVLPSDSNEGVHFGYSFSDVTVLEWRFVESPSLESEVTNG